MAKIFCGLFLFFSVLAYHMFVPEIVCTVHWVDSELRPIDGPFHECIRSLEMRHIGFTEYARLGTDVYRVSKVHGGALPSRGLRQRVSKNVVFIRLDGPIDWGKLQQYLGGRYVSDGKVILNMEGKRILSLTPAIDMEKLRPVPGSPVESRRHSDYMTDGRWVILNDKIVKDAEALTFRQIYALELGGYQVESNAQMQFGRDKKSVYYLDRKLENADPNSFGLVSYNDCRNPPQGIEFNSDQVERGAGWVAVDGRQAWEVDFTGATPLTVTEPQLLALQNDLKQANAASTSVLGEDFDENACKR